MLKMPKRFGNLIEISEIEEGLLIAQAGEAYVARGWGLSDSVNALIHKAIDCGLGWMIQVGHPKNATRWPSRKGVVYISFGPSPDLQWSIAIDSFRVEKNDFGVVVFNGKYHSQFQHNNIPFTFEKRNKTSGHLIVSRENVMSAIAAVGGFDHSVLELNRSTREGEGFTTEDSIQRQILENWTHFIFAKHADIVQDEFPIDGGFNSRRIDILARDRITGGYLVIELKRAEATIDAVHQVEDYVAEMGARDDFSPNKLQGVLIAERIPPHVRKAAADASIDTYEISWPAALKIV